MKFKITAIVIFLLILALLPVSITFFDRNDTDIDKIDKNKHIYNYVASLYEDDYTDETVKAIAIICQTNYDFNSDKFKYNNNTSKKNLEHIEKIIDKTEGYKLSYKQKYVYIPFSKSSNGTTYTNDNYTYLSSTASPWDRYSQDFDKNSKCIGVSLYGINYLCKNGETAESALKWYLPDFEIIKTT